MSAEHKPNGPYYPIGLLAGESCRLCRKPWPCTDADLRQCGKGNPEIVLEIIEIGERE